MTILDDDSKNWPLLIPGEEITIREINGNPAALHINGLGIKKAKRIFNLPSKLDAERGRGLFLIHECFDDVRWSRKGNRLQIAFRRNQ